MAIKTYSRGSAERLATNFRAKEFDCNGSGCCKETKIDEKLVEILQKIRDHFGKPVVITAYRCPVWNAKVANAASRSYHMYGQAADLHIDGVAPAEIAKYAESIGVLGIGLYDTEKDGHFVHIDTRTSKSFWYGHAQERRTTFGGAPAPEPVSNTYTLEQFVRDVQAATGSEADGIAGPETIGNTVTVSAYKNQKHPVVAPIQKRLAALGYTQVGEADGVAGSKFTAAVLAFQEDNRCWQDGEITAKNKTWRCLLGMG
jgi:hypothetical protein